MKLSTRSTYGMRALVELGLASGYGPVSAALIAKRQELSVAYLEQLLHRLRKQGLISSVRGPRGGYVLAKEPQRITMADVVRILDGANGAEGGGAREPARRLAPNGKTHTRSSRQDGKDAPRPASSESQGGRRHAQRITQAVWRCVHERLTQSLGAVTLQDLCDEAGVEAGDPLDHRYVFHI